MPELNARAQHKIEHLAAGEKPCSEARYSAGLCPRQVHPQIYARR